MIECLLGTSLRRRERGHVSYTIGETVVYSHHGTTRIEDVFTRKIYGEEETRLKLRVVQGDLEIQVPVGMLEDVGIRNVSDDE